MAKESDNVGARNFECVVCGELRIYHFPQLSREALRQLLAAFASDDQREETLLRAVRSAELLSNCRASVLSVHSDW